MTAAAALDTRTAARGRNWSPWLWVTAIYAGLTLFYAWPLLPVMGTRLPVDAGDPGLNAWILWWNAQAFPLTERWWNAPIFFPLSGAFALSETLLSLTPLTTPLLWAGISPVVVYNIAFLVSFPTAALAAHALAHRLTGRHDAALLAGLAFGFNPYRAAQIPHLQMLWSCWMPLCLLALHRYLDARRVRFLVLVGVCWLLNGLTSGYFLVYFAVLFGCWMLWFARPRRDWAGIGIALAVASCLLAPVLAGYAWRHQALGLARESGEVDKFAADLSGVWATSSYVWLPSHWTIPPKFEGELYPGVVIVVLMIVGATVAWRQAATGKWSRLRFTIAVLSGYLAEVALLTAALGPWRTSLFGVRISATGFAKPLLTSVALLVVTILSDRRVREAWRRRSPLFFYAAAALLMLVFALGPVGRLFGDAFWSGAPYSWMMELPGGRALRVPARFAMLFVLCLAQAAALAFARLTPRGARVPIVAGIAVAIFLEGWVPQLITKAAAAPMTVRVADHGEPLLELPDRDLYSGTAAMLRATGHGRRLVNGFSGYWPPHYVAMREGLQAHESSVLDALRTFGPMLVLVNTALDPTGVEDRFVRQQTQVEFLDLTSEGPLFRLTALPATPPASPGSLLAIAAIHATVNPDKIALMSDGRLDTRWHTMPQTPGDRVTVQLAAPARMSRLDLDLGRFNADHPRRFRIEVGGAEGDTTVAWEGTTAGFAMLGALADPDRTTMAISLPDRAVGSRLILTQTGEHPWMYWSIAEIRVYGR